MGVRILNGDCLDVMRTLEPCSVDAIVTDPPYGLKFMGKDWDHGTPGEHFWREAIRVAKPGAHLLAFSGSRTFHRMWCAVEDAGWEIRDTLMWLYGEGFPKSSNQRGEWEGWGTALKPAFEPILMARKPLIGTVAQNLETHSTGALNIDASRVQYVNDADKENAAAAEQRSRQTSRNFDGWGMKAQDLTAEKYMQGGASLGRWPANVLHDGSDEVVAAFPSEAGAAAPVHRRNGDKFRTTFGAFAGNVDEQGSTFHGDSGSAARFFWCPKASRKDRNEGLEGMPRKAVNWSSGDQSPGTFQSQNTQRDVENHHPTVKPTELMRYLCRLVTPRGGGNPRPVYGVRQYRKSRCARGILICWYRNRPAVHRYCQASHPFRRPAIRGGLVMLNASHSHHDRAQLANVLRSRGHSVNKPFTKSYRRAAK